MITFTLGFVAAIVVGVYIWILIAFYKLSKKVKDINIKLKNSIDWEVSFCDQYHLDKFDLIRQIEILQQQNKKDGKKLLKG